MSAGVRGAADRATTPIPARRFGDWKWIFAYGASLTFLGLVLVAWPFAGAIAIGVFLGWALCIAGIFGIVTGLRARHLRRHRLDAVVGAVSLVLGLLILPYPLINALSLLLAISLWFAVTAVMEIGYGLGHKQERAALLLRGGLDLLLAILLFSGFTGGYVELVAILMGVSFLVSGAATALLAVRIRAVER